MLSRGAVSSKETHKKQTFLFHTRLSLFSYTLACQSVENMLNEPKSEQKQVCLICAQKGTYVSCKGAKLMLRHIQHHINAEQQSTTESRLRIVSSCFPEFLEENGVHAANFHEIIGRKKEVDKITPSPLHQLRHASPKAVNLSITIDTAATTTSYPQHSKRRLLKKGPKEKTECHICSKVVVRLLAHLVSHREKTIQCPHCDYKAKENSRMKEHIRDIHESIKKYTCDVCLYRCNRPRELVRHQRNNHGHGTKEIAEKKFICDDCGRFFAKTYNINLHQQQQSHLRQFFYKCEECGIRFCHLSTYKRHILVHGGKRQYACDVCGQLLNGKPDLKAHMTIHTGERGHECQVCGDAFRVHVLLRNHKRKYNHFY